MGLEKILTLPNRENIGFYVVSGAYMLAGIVDSLLLINGSDSGAATGSGPLAHFLVDYYTSFAAVTASEIMGRRTIGPHKNIMCNLLYTGAALSAVGALGWMSSLCSFSK